MGDHTINAELVQIYDALQILRECNSHRRGNLLPYKALEEGRGGPQSFNLKIRPHM